MAALDIVSLDTATPQLEVPGAADTYAAPRALAISPVALTGSTATPALDIAQTWNTTGTPTALRLSVTDTASNAASNLLELRGGAAGTTSLFSVDKAGTVKLKNSGTITWTDAGNLTFSSGDGFQRVRAYSLWATTLAAGIGDSNIAGGSQVHLSSAGTLGWTSGAAINQGTYDVFLHRDDVGVLAQRRTTVGGTTYPQAFRIYNAFTDSANYERGKIAWESNILRIGTEKTGVGFTARALELQTDGTTRLTIAAAGAATFSSTVTGGGLGFQAPTTAYFYFAGRSLIQSPADGRLQLSNNAQTDFDRLQFGGTTSSFPALKRDTARLVVRLADDSANAALESASVKTDAPTGGTSGTWKLGVAATVSPTSPNRTIEVDIGGTIYYVHAKTTND